MKNKNLWRVVALLLIVSLSSQLYAQTSEKLSMSLEECLKYAKDNSITLKKAQLQIDNSVADELSAKGNFLPNVSGSVGQNVAVAPFITNSNGSKTSYVGSYGLDLSMTLYNGGKNKSLLQQSSVNTEISNLELEELANSIEVSITELYIEILYSIEQIEVANKSLEVSKKNEERGKALFEVGSMNSAEYAQLVSATASDMYNLVVAESQLSTLYVQIKHLLEVPFDTEFAVKVPNLNNGLLISPISTVMEVYNSALVERPEIKSTKLSIESSEFDLQIAKTGYLPTVSLSAGTGFSHSTASNYKFTTQLRNNADITAGVTVSIPIFTGYANRTAVTKAQNNIRTATLNQSQAEKDLYQTVETLYNNAVTAQAKYSVSEYQLKAVEESLGLVTQQYELGMKNIIELLTEQDSYNQSYQDYLINKYQLIYNKAILNYYKTNIIKL